MAFRQVLKYVIRRSRPLMYASSTLFVENTTLKKPTADQKLTLEPPNIENLSYDYMIKQSTIETVNTTSQILTVTYSAIETTSKEYRNVLTRLISLIRETLSHDVSDSHWDMIVAIRSEVQNKKIIVTQLIGFMDYVHKMAVATSETTYLAGMDNLSTTLCQRIDDVLLKIQKEVDHNKELEDEYRLIQQQCIIKSPKDDDSQDQREEQISVQVLNTDLEEVVHPISS